MTTFSVDTSRGTVKAYPRKTDDSLHDAATRAVKRLYGRSAGVWRWVEDGWRDNRHGMIVERFYRGTIVGPKVRKADSYPILGEARFSISNEG